MHIPMLAITTDATYFHVYVGIVRYAAPVLAAIIILRCILPLISFRKEPEIWAWLLLKKGQKLPVTHWENAIGSSKRSDIVIADQSVARTHAVLTRYDDGSWSIAATDNSDGVFLNGEQVEMGVVTEEDTITLGKVRMKLRIVDAQQSKTLSELRTTGSSFFKGLTNIILLTLFQLMCMLGYLLGAKAGTEGNILLAFGGIMVFQWLLYMFYVGIRRTAFELETIAFFLCTMGMAAICSVVPNEALKQLFSVGLGLGAFLVIGWALRDLERAKILRIAAAVAGVGLLLITLAFGKEYYGAKNWLDLGSFSFQPSELSKVCFVLVGASTMDRLVKKRNLILFIAYSASICACLALMNDFGTALIFFCAFLVIAYLRSGSVGTLALAIAALVFAGVVALKIAPHALQRFASWRHIWEDPFDTGYQQTRALMCIASGGLFGLGPTRGWMKNLFAADSDMVIATIAEEWGLLMVLICIISIVAVGIFVMRSCSVGRSSFYTIGACTAASILLVQTILNALGTLDVLPLTGVTFPFLSNGGSSMICTWGLLAFIKASDTRQNASFAIRLTQKGETEDE